MEDAATEAVQKALEKISDQERRLEEGFLRIREWQSDLEKSQLINAKFRDRILKQLHEIGSSGGLTGVPL